ncbi:chymotrypsin inhibitor SCI-II-like [Achroia grisella]|uniref:chymotrypsin inhibitor SCI-II-like n=1 Tax=Achroia grisella TaxID=688607 RepID=UPI0027D22C1D|nr:chymotrypsin inhibitor SCI-II-like [Achroia grisella]XP_059058855.1 chymotrypsin inhibitor SCI-II-like [Achroia grisella]XP_059058856.1 chymotrypsin inhibitor SCI-II-like [Achroia grisella]
MCDKMKLTVILIVLVTLLDLSREEEIKGPCDLPILSGMCFGYREVYGYNVTRNKCAKFIYGGCMGNDNRFDSIQECESSCLKKEIEEDKDD